MDAAAAVVDAVEASVAKPAPMANPLSKQAPKPQRP